MRKWQLTLGAIVLIFGAILAGIFHAYKTFLATPLIPTFSQPITYILVPGTSTRMLAMDLQKQGLLKNPVFFIALVYSKNQHKQLKAGEYLFLPGMTPEQVLAKIVAGKVIQHRFTIIEGWTFQQLITALNKEPSLTHTANISPKEGWFFPATYNFILGTTDSHFLEKAYALMKIKLNAAWQQRASNLPYKTPDEALIAASLVEKESARPEERPLIAGVLVKRLQQNMPLQIDSTVIYGLGAAYTGKIHTADLRQDTPYNTYTRKGLPPTPIAMPSESSIQATLHPSITDALYFVAKGDGSHQFSNNLNDHNHAVVTYQLNKKSNAAKIAKPWYVPDSLQFLFSKAD